MKSLTLQQETEERLEVPVTATTDPTDFNVEFSFPALGERPTVWTAGLWLANAVGAGRDFEAIALTPTIGKTGSDVVLTVGTYGMYVRITADVEIPVLYAGQITVK